MIVPMATFAHHDFPVLNPSLKTVDFRFYATARVSGATLAVPSGVIPL